MSQQDRRWIPLSCLERPWIDPTSPGALCGNHAEEEPIRPELLLGHGFCKFSDLFSVMALNPPFPLGMSICAASSFEMGPHLEFLEMRVSAFGLGGVN